MSSKAETIGDVFTVVRPMNAHGAVTVRSATTNATYHLVAHADESTRRALSSLAPGESVSAAVSRIGGRGNGFRVEAATPRPAGAGPNGITAGD
ncbi:hypothetical protein [Halobellus ruber]|uniref:DUF7999 domain-containing protein n=1 Tax=Halobellus ruber TaxID=2761102 RepID=A0A7J9SJ26_9EURY|nr:hypothetical protein [Halobellus ruber]MBB6645011.1 hypothetical protein [Halobellus ruber]